MSAVIKLILKGALSMPLSQQINVQHVTLVNGLLFTCYIKHLFKNNRSMFTCYIKHFVKNNSLDKRLLHFYQVCQSIDKKEEHYDPNENNYGKRQM